MGWSVAAEQAPSVLYLSRGLQIDHARNCEQAKSKEVCTGDPFLNKRQSAERCGGPIDDDHEQRDTPRRSPEAPPSYRVHGPPAYLHTDRRCVHRGPRANPNRIPSQLSCHDRKERAVCRKLQRMMTTKYPSAEMEVSIVTYTQNW
jgi:hypothetical protein